MQETQRFLRVSSLRNAIKVRVHRVLVGHTPAATGGRKKPRNGCQALLKQATSASLRDLQVCCALLQELRHP